MVSSTGLASPAAMIDAPLDAPSVTSLGQDIASRVHFLEREADEREKQGFRSRSIGMLLPDIRRYHEDEPEEKDIEAAIGHDLKQSPALS